MIPDHIWVSTKRDTKKYHKRLSILQSSKYQNTKYSLLNPESYFSSNPQKKITKKNKSLESQRKNAHQLHSNLLATPRVRPLRSKSNEEYDSVRQLMTQRVEPIHSQKSHNVLQLLKSLNKLTPRKQTCKIKFKSQNSHPFSFTIKNNKNNEKNSQQEPHRQAKQRKKKRMKSIYSLITPHSPFPHQRPKTETKREAIHNY